jgi:predicted transcriptional regulator
MEIYVPNDLLKTVSEVLTAEKVAFQVTDQVYSLMVEGKKIAEVTTVNAEVMETDVPLIYDQGPEINLRAFRLPSGKKFLITDAKGNLVRLAEAPPGWER